LKTAFPQAPEKLPAREVFAELTESTRARIFSRAAGLSTPWLIGKNDVQTTQPHGFAQHPPYFCRLRMRKPLLLLLLVFCAISFASAADELLPPFGFRWNDPMSRVEAVLNGAKAQIVSREKKEGREIWTVEGLVHPGLKRTLFTFKAGALFGVELQYEYPDWTIERYNQRMGEIRKYFDEKYGTGKLVSRSRDSDTDVIQTLVGYQWMVGATMLQLFYFSAEQGTDHVYRAISVDYKAL
jgi:hypothetical protein